MSSRPFPTVPPPGYLCHKCRRSGHFIYDCPENKPRTTGIPVNLLNKPATLTVANPGVSINPQGKFYF